MSMAYEEYMREMVKPMRAELTAAGFHELKTAEDVEEYMKNAKGTTLVFVNSVCGCAAGLARPATVQSLTHETKPDHLVTVFAGQDKEATARMRKFFGDLEPSSPSLAILKGHEVVHFIPRDVIEDEAKENIIHNLQEAYNKYC